METRIVLTPAGLVVNRIMVADEGLPRGFSAGDGLTIHDLHEAEADMPVYDDDGQPTGATATVIVPIAIGGAYVAGVYTPVEQ